MATPKQSGPFLKNGIHDLRLIEWAKSWNWDMCIPSAPAPFNNWFPASESDVGKASVTSYEWSAGNQTLKTPLSTSPKEMRVTFSDDDKGTLEDWLDDWVNKKIFEDGRVQTLSEATKIAFIARLNNKRQAVSIEEYLIYPEGGINTVRDSQSNVLVHVVTFTIAGVSRNANP